jgi:ring-1,2-phenylacetyl-CoA epoxidase subunit PaaA
LCEGIDIKVPAHLDQTTKQYVIDYPFPCQYDPAAKRWLFDQPLTWDQVFERWKARGPMNQEYIGMVQGMFKKWGRGDVGTRGSGHGN